MTNGWNYADVWEAIAKRFPDEVAQECEDASYTWTELDRRADGLAAAFLEAGLGQQAKVAQHLFNGPEYLESVYAAFKVGMVPVNTNYRYVERELEYLWDNADVEAVVFDSDLADRCERVRAELPRIKLWLCVDAGDGCPDWAVPYESAASSRVGRTRAPWGRSGDDILLLYTGGTTGMPKGVMWPQHEMISMLDSQGRPGITAAADAESHAAGLTKVGPKVLPAAPLMHGTSLWFALSAMQSAGAVVTMPNRRYDAVALLDTIVEKQVKGLCIVGDAFARPLLDELRAAPDRWSLGGLRVVLSSGVMFSPDVKEALLEHADNALILDTLGTSESGTMARSETTKGSAAALARFKLGEHLRVIDDDGVDVVPGSGVAGRLAVSGHIPLGYYKDPEKTAQTFVTIGDRRFVVAGDWAEVELDGTIRLLGRGSGTINTGGEKVFPEEVEEALKNRSGIVDAAVVGVPDERLGQRIVAVVEAEPGIQLNPEDVIRAVKGELAAYKAPKAIVQVDDIGRGPNGKLDYARLAEIAAADATISQNS
jgi:acyl-CoA synthetase (AMP-forming)/AMP-acid ligase II